LATVNKNHRHFQSLGDGDDFYFVNLPWCCQVNVTLTAVSMLALATIASETILHLQQ
jgi:hypothetical protein